MTSNLVSMDISSEEVNNNNQEKAGCSGAIEPALVFNRKEATTGDTTASTVPAAAIVSLSGPSPTASVYSLNDTFRIKVTSAEEWLCVARMPRDFTQTELESLLDEFGPIHQCFLIHSEISGDFFCSITLSVQKSIQKSVQKSVQNASGLTQTELESLLDEFGPIHQCFLIHSEISGDFLCSITLSVKKSI